MMNLQLFSALGLVTGAVEHAAARADDCTLRSFPCSTQPERNQQSAPG